MAGKTILQGLVLVLIVSLAVAAIYAAESGEVSHDDSSNGQAHLYISGSGDVSHVMGSVSPIHSHSYMPTVYV
ncbi:hypothetical protein [Methanobrevibacter sp.]